MAMFPDPALEAVCSRAPSDQTAHAFEQAAAPRLSFLLPVPARKLSQLPSVIDPGFGTMVLRDPLARCVMLPMLGCGRPRGQAALRGD